MTMEILGLTDDGTPVKAVQTALEELRYSMAWYSLSSELEGKLESTEKVILFLKESENYDIYELCKELILTYPHITIVLLIQGDNLDYKRAMRVGASDVVELSGNPDQLTLVMKEIFATAQMKIERGGSLQENEQRKTGKTITVCSSKGGVGKTTVATNLAATLARQGSKVAITDMDLQFGDVAMMFDEKPKRSIYEWVKEEYSQGQLNLERYITQHQSGVHILASPLRPEFAEVITSDHVIRLISELKSAYDFIIIDTPPDLRETTITAIECSDEILLIVSMDLPTIKNCRLFIETLESVGIHNRIKVILNRESKTKGIEPEIIENILQVPVLLRIPNDEKTVLPSVNKGVPFMLSDNKKSAVAKQFLWLSSQFNGNQAKKETKKSFLSKLMLSFKG